MTVSEISALLLKERQGAIVFLTFNRPEARNALSRALVRETIDALHNAEKTGARLIVLRGTGGNFCAGADLKDLKAAREAPITGGKDPLIDLNAEFGALCAAFARTPLATVAVLEGAIMGGGFGLACVADVAIAGPTADFRLPEVALGIVPAQIAPYLVERIGYAQAKRLAITAARFDAQEAYRLGLVDHVCSEQSDIATKVRATLHDLLAGAPGAIAETKRWLARVRFEKPDAFIDEAARLFATATRGVEGEEGVRAFLEKRKPFWA